MHLNGTHRKIINQIPPHTCFVEPFMGGHPLIALKRRAKVNIGVDCDPDVVATAIERYQDCGFTILQDDAISFLASYRWLHPQGGELVYCDPPRPSTSLRSAQDGGGGVEHAHLLEVLKRLPCMVMITGAWSELYEHELEGWRTISYVGGDGVEEFLWMNFPQPFELHDYRYLGNGYRERDRIKRKKDRWRKRLADMPLLERYALLQEINALSRDTAGRFSTVP